MARLFAKPQIVYRNGRPHAVILDLPQFERLLEKLEDAEDLRDIRRLRRKKPRFASLKDYLGRRH